MEEIDNDAKTEQRHLGGHRRTADVTTSTIATNTDSMQDHEFRDILDTAFQAQSDTPLRSTDALGECIAGC